MQGFLSFVYGFAGFAAGAALVGLAQVLVVTIGNKFVNIYED